MNPTQRGTATAISAPFHIASLGQHINQIPAPIAHPIQALVLDTTITT
ncbi:hypothetical protein [Acinetobacter pullicarnis]|nr:hypothetical protein [Acinetobacter pullicarnis]